MKAREFLRTVRTNHPEREFKSNGVIILDRLTPVIPGMFGQWMKTGDILCDGVVDQGVVDSWLEEKK